MKKKRTIILLTTFSILIFALGYFRNYAFLNINERAALLYYHEKYPPMPGIFGVFENYDYNSLITVKWIFTAIFTTSFAMLSAITLYFIYNSRTAALTTITVYALLSLISFLFLILGRLIPAFNYHGFNIARNVSHFQQSPVIVILLLLGFYAFKKQ